MLLSKLVWLTVHETSTETPGQVSIAFARSVQNEHWIARNGCWIVKMREAKNVAKMLPPHLKV